MGVEFELKYAASPECLEGIFRETEGVWQEITMETTYYDTPGEDLSRHRFTLRRRLENGQSVCTVKTPAGDHDRGEWETENDCIEAAVPVLCKLGAPALLAALTAGGVIPVCGARFLRRACTLDTGSALVELALDRGVLFSGDRQIPLCEAEVELKSGSREAAVAFGAFLAKKYGLQPEEKSKFRRALDLRKEK